MSPRSLKLNPVTRLTRPRRANDKVLFQDDCYSRDEYSTGQLHLSILYRTTFRTVTTYLSRWCIAVASELATASCVTSRL